VKKGARLPGEFGAGTANTKHEYEIHLLLIPGSDDPGASAISTCYGNVSSNVLVSGTVDTSTPGSYLLSYSITNLNGQLFTKLRSVIVDHPTPPTLAIQPLSGMSSNQVQLSATPFLGWTLQQSANLVNWFDLEKFVADPTTNFVVNTGPYGNDPSFNAFPLTVTAWFNSTQTNGGGALVNKYQSGSLNGYQLFLLNSHLNAWYFGAGGNIYNNGILDAGVVTDGQWHHAALVVDASSGRIYLDGVLKQTVTWAGTPAVTTTINGLQFGIYPGTFTALSYYSGLLDEVSIWNRALATNEIQSCMSFGLTGSETNLLGYWRMDEGSRSLAGDSSLRGNVARLFNSPAWVAPGAPITNGAGFALQFNGTNQSSTVDYRPQNFFRARYP
jgi:hypothetical protein